MNVSVGQPLSGFGEGQCFPKLSDPENSLGLLLKAVSQAQPFRFIRPGVDPGILPCNGRICCSHGLGTTAAHS